MKKSPQAATPTPTPDTLQCVYPECAWKGWLKWYGRRSIKNQTALSLEWTGNKKDKAVTVGYSSQNTSTGMGTERDRSVWTMQFQGQTTLQFVKEWFKKNPRHPNVTCLLQDYFFNLNHVGCLPGEEWQPSLELQLVVIHFASSIMFSSLMKLGSLSLKNDMSKEYRLSNFRYGIAIKNILAMNSLEVQGHRLTLWVYYTTYFFKRKELLDI